MIVLERWRNPEGMRWRHRLIVLPNGGLAVEYWDDIAWRPCPHPQTHLPNLHRKRKP